MNELPLVRRRGFTIVELLIVVVVIGILAAIVTVAYNGVTRRAIETAMQSDLQSASTQLSSAAISSGTYPADGSGLVASNGTTLSYVNRAYGYCLGATNPKTSKVYVVKSRDNAVREGDCNATGATYTNTLTAGYSDGSCSTAQFNFQPTTNGSGSDAVWDAAGNMYVADPGNQVIRKITPDCTVSIYAGTQGVAGTLNGPALSARFNYPVAIVMNSAGDLLVGDRGSGNVRRITASGDVSTYATGVSFGRSGGMAIYNDILYVTRDASGSTPHTIARVLVGGTVQQFAGNGVAGFADGMGTSAQFNAPTGIAVDSVGNLYVADSGNERIRKVTPDGQVSTYAGTGTRGSTDGAALTTATFASPRAIAVDKAGWVYTRGTGYYAGSYNDARLRAISPSGVVMPIYWNNSMSNSGSMTPYAIEIDKDFNIWLLQSDGPSGANIYKVAQ